MGDGPWVKATGNATTPFARSSAHRFSASLAVAATLLTLADAMITGAISQATMLCGLLSGQLSWVCCLVWALMSAHRTRPLAERLDARSMLSLTITAVLAIMAIFEAA